MKNILLIAQHQRAASRRNIKDINRRLETKVLPNIQIRAQGTRQRPDYSSKTEYGGAAMTLQKRITR